MSAKDVTERFLTCCDAVGLRSPDRMSVRLLDTVCLRWITSNLICEVQITDDPMGSMTIQPFIGDASVSTFSVDDDKNFAPIIEVIKRVVI